MTFKEVSQLTGIPYQTLLGWERAGGYRRNLARFLKSCDRAALEKYFAEASPDMIVENGDIVAVEKNGNFSVATYPTEGRIISILQKFKKI